MTSYVFRALVVATVLLATIAPTAVAQPASPQPTATETEAGQAERIDADTEIVASEYDDEAGVARITLRSSAAQAVALSDAGAFQEGGEVPMRSVALSAGETATVELPVTEVDGTVGVAISTDKTPIYAEILETGGGGLDILRALSSMQAWLAGAGVAFTWMVIAGYNVLRREDGRPEVA